MNNVLNLRHMHRHFMGFFFFLVRIITGFSYKDNILGNVLKFPRHSLPAFSNTDMTLFWTWHYWQDNNKHYHYYYYYDYHGPQINEDRQFLAPVLHT